MSKRSSYIARARAPADTFWDKYRTGRAAGTPTSEVAAEETGGGSSQATTIRSWETPFDALVATPGAPNGGDKDIDMFGAGGGGDIDGNTRGGDAKEEEEKDEAKEDEEEEAAEEAEEEPLREEETKETAPVGDEVMVISAPALANLEPRCFRCGTVVDPLHCRISGKSSGCWCCRKCNTNGTQLVRVFGSWPPKSFASLPKDFQEKHLERHRRPPGRRSARATCGADDGEAQG